MTNLFTTSALIKVIDEYYNTAVLTMRAQQQNNRVVPKALLYTIGSTLIATIIYKSVKAVVPAHLDYTGTAFIRKGQTSTSSLSFNFLSTAIKSLSNVLKYKKTVSKPEEILFEDKYFKEYDEWIEAHPDSNNTDDNDNKNVIIDPVEEQHRKECLENMYYSTVREKINDFYGDVIMCYDHATLSFAYYARTGNIPYKYLETISRKYMIETNAPREIYVDIRNEYKKAKERTTNTNTNNGAVAATVQPQVSTDASTATAAAPAETDVFVKLKSYNTASNLNLHTTTNDTKEKTHKFVGSVANTNANEEMDTTTASTSTNHKVIRERANRYSYRGKLDDFEEHHKTFLADRRKAAAAKAEAEAGTAGETKEQSVSSYAEYKKQMMKSV